MAGMRTMDNPGKDEGLHKKQQPVFSRTAAFIYNYVHIGLTQQTGKLLLVGLLP